MIEIHADDFGLFPKQSERIVRCITKGKLNGISIMPNSQYLGQCMEMLYDKVQDRRLFLTVHLNLVEGKALTGASHLTDDQGVFAPSFGKLLIISYLPFLRKKYRKAIKGEMDAQIAACMPYYEGKKPAGLDAGAERAAVTGKAKRLRLDGHCHFHMLPVVFDAIVDVIEEKKLDVEYIRMPKEDLKMYFASRRRMEAFRWINLVKVLILNFLVRRNEKVLNHRGYAGLNGHGDMFSGVMYSGRMGLKNAQAVADYVLANKLTRRGHVEILLHPGGVYEAEDLAEVTDAGDREFLADHWRRKEEQAAIELSVG